MGIQPKYSIRPATVEDLNQMVAIEKMCYPVPWDSEHFNSELAKPHSVVWVLTDDETDQIVAGYIVFWLQVESCSLLNVAVHMDYRGVGFGEKLIRAMINEVVRTEYPRIILEVRKSNLGAIKLYEKIGFKKTHERKNFYQDGETAYVYELETSNVLGRVQ